MVHTRNSATTRKSTSRIRSSTPIATQSMIKRHSGPSSHSKRQHQKQQHFKQERRRVAFAAQRARRERWASIAQDTQSIVLGDGKYVEESHSDISFSTSVFVSSASLNQFSAPSYSVLASSSLNTPIVNSEKPMTPHPQGQTKPTVATATRHISHDIGPQILLSKQGTTFYPHCSPSLADWRKSDLARRADSPMQSTIIHFTPSPTLTAARRLHNSNAETSGSRRSLTSISIGVLSFASPKRAGGGYLHGGNEQEEGLARCSSLVASLRTDQAKEFYKTHRRFLSMDGAGIHDHSMVYSPGVVVFRGDDDDSESNTASTDDSNILPTLQDSNKQSTFIPPYTINVLSAVPVNAAAIRQNYLITASDAHVFSDGIRDKMRDRMARALRIFQTRGDQTLVLGAFGCGSCENRVEMIAELWAELLVCGERTSGGAKYKDVFEEIVFAVPGKHFEPFKKAFEMRVFEAELSDAASDTDV